MIRGNLHSICFALLLFSVFLLVACGEETESIRVTERYTLDMLGKGVSLTEEVCDSARLGLLLYVGDSSSIYYCTGRVWKKVNGADGKDGRDGQDGADGTDGKRGRYGVSGTDCFIDKFADGFSLGCGATKAVIRYDFEIPDTCSIELDEDSSYVLRCGDEKAKLRQGSQGDAGDICRQTDIGGGQVRLVCGNDSVTTYKAQCGEIPFDPDGLLFCYGDTLVERCNTHAYDIEKQFCYNDSLVDMCGGKTYDLTEQFCYGDSIIALCGGKGYDLTKVFCYNDSLVDMCGGKGYDLAQQFCYSDSLVDFCGGKTYELKQQFCYSDSLVDLCAGWAYDVKQQFCHGDTIVSLCGGKNYNLAQQFCYGDTLVDFCGGKDYDLAQQFCYRDSIISLCGGKYYDLAQQFCYNDSLIDLCGGNDYNPKQQFCYNDSLVDLCGGKSYDLELKFCFNGALVNLCGGKDYNPKQQFCYNDSFVDMCGGKTYDFESAFCFGDTVVTRCGGEHYVLSVQFCYDNLLYDLCDGESYDVQRYTCYNNEIVPYECPRKPEYYLEPYDFEQEFCYIEKDILTGEIIDEYLVERCGGKSYDLKQKFCYNDSLIDLCGGRDYDLAQQFCYSDSLIDLCGGKDYDLARQFCDERNWRVYKYTKINGVTWMADNLDYRVPDSFCDSIHKDNNMHCGIKGRFYVWSAAMAMPESVCGYGHSCENDIQYPHQGVCPDGWHLPTKEEWDELLSFMGTDRRVYLDSSVQLYENTYGTDDYGFSAIPTGFVVTDSSHVGRCTSNVDGSRRYDDYLYCRLSIGTKNSTGFDAWTSTESRDPDRSSSSWVYVFYFYTDGGHYGDLSTSTWYKSVSRTVRCVKNEEEQ